MYLDLNIDPGFRADFRERAEWWREVGPGPCDDCPQRQRCADQYEACIEFKHWVDRGRVSGDLGREPSREIYNVVFATD